MRSSWPCLALFVAAAALAASAGFRVSSPAFADGASIPPQYACDGNNASPPLAWTDPPLETKSFALIISDHLASHAVVINWVVYDIPASQRKLESRYGWLSRQKDGTIQGRNGANETGYLGPCPGPRTTHAYAIDLYALDTRLPDKIGLSAADLARAMQGHILAKSRLTGTYRRHF